MFFFTLALLLVFGLLIALSYVYGLLDREREKVARGALREEEQRSRIGKLAQKCDDLQESVNAGLKREEDVNALLRDFMEREEGYTAELKVLSQENERLKRSVIAEPVTIPVKRTRRKVGSAE